ncbi:hypothetical protein [Stenotrophomonas sp. PS02300]|uniref:hypothetical protein n=1 Tax=Stenotrophomonas sp. PS02300 TaxID=2991426 RepID=UPI00249CE0F8|nr:hypothetical protein [Stenotrophomonas sp. PS02300]
MTPLILHLHPSAVESLLERRDSKSVGESLSKALMQALSDADAGVVPTVANTNAAGFLPAEVLFIQVTTLEDLIELNRGTDD